MGKHKHKKKHKEKKEKRKRRSSSSSESDEWVEKEPIHITASEKLHDQEHSSQSLKNQSDALKESEKTSCFGRNSESDSQQKRDDWMDLPTSFSSFSHSDRRAERDKQKQLDRLQQIYNPSTCTRELNPYWKDGGDGLPKFKRPNDEIDQKKVHHSNNAPSRSQGWRKRDTTNTKQDQKISGWRKRDTTDTKQDQKISPVNDIKTFQETKISDKNECLSDKDLNILASKLVKAEIMGNTKLAEELKEKLEKARQLKTDQKDTDSDHVLLTHTDSKGYSRPVRQHNDIESTSSGSKSKKQKIETHKDGQRMRYFADDDKYSLKQMFEREKYVSIHDQNKEFVQMARNIHKNDDLDEVFEDRMRYKSDSKEESKTKDKAISDHQIVSRSLDNCNRCLQSDNMLKHLMISMGETVYLALPHHEPLVDGHCLIVPIRHVPCATQLDENEWQELMDFRKALTKMFNSLDQTVIFFETAMYLHRFPHMSIECVPLPHEQGDMLPFYFKKAIDESEFEWSHNKKLIDLKGRNVQKAIPKGLSYFSVSFDMEEGYAHVIEEEKYFPQNFAQEIIGGMLDLDHFKWRKPRRQNFDDQSKRVLAFSKLWTDFDITKNK